MNKKLLFSVTKKDLEIQTFTSGGPGGQNQNRCQTGIRIIHKESGAVGEARDTRSQHANKKLAFGRLANSSKFRLWLKLKTYEIISQKTIEERVEEQMNPKFFKTEIKDEKGKWVELEELMEDIPSLKEAIKELANK